MLYAIGAMPAFQFFRLVAEFLREALLMIYPWTLNTSEVNAIQSPTVT